MLPTTIITNKYNHRYFPLLSAVVILSQVLITSHSVQAQGATKGGQLQPQQQQVHRQPPRVVGSTKSSPISSSNNYASSNNNNNAPIARPQAPKVQASIDRVKQSNNYDQPQIQRPSQYGFARPQTPQQQQQLASPVAVTQQQQQQQDGDDYFTPQDQQHQPIDYSAGYSTGAGGSSSSAATHGGANSNDDLADSEPALYGSVAGTPGVDFPNYTRIPKTSFSCEGRPYDFGMYADEETKCQAFHVCWQGRRESFLCGVGTVFNQAILACDYWHSVDCSKSSQFYSANEQLGKSSAEPASQQLQRPRSQQPAAQLPARQNTNVQQQQTYGDNERGFTSPAQRARATLTTVKPDNSFFGAYNSNNNNNNNRATTGYNNNNQAQFDDRQSIRTVQQQPSAIYTSQQQQPRQGKTSSLRPSAVQSPQPARPAPLQAPVQQPAQQQRITTPTSSAIVSSYDTLVDDDQQTQDQQSSFDDTPVSVTSTPSVQPTSGGYSSRQSSQYGDTQPLQKNYANQQQQQQRENIDNSYASQQQQLSSFGDADNTADDRQQQQQADDSGSLAASTQHRNWYIMRPLTA